MSACHREMVQPGVVLGQWWHRLDDGRIQCDLCPRECKLHEGQRGFCFVRQAQDGGVVLTTYGRASGFCIDPIEKKPLNHFYPGTSVLSFGTAGCNLGCRFWQNWGAGSTVGRVKLFRLRIPRKAAVVEGVDVYGACSLSQVVHFLRGDIALEPVRSTYPRTGGPRPDQPNRTWISGRSRVSSMSNAPSKSPPRAGTTFFVLDHQDPGNR